MESVEMESDATPYEYAIMNIHIVPCYFYQDNNGILNLDYFIIQEGGAIKNFIAFTG